MPSSAAAVGGDGLLVVPTPPLVAILRAVAAAGALAGGEHHNEFRQFSSACEAFLTTFDTDATEDDALERLELHSDSAASSSSPVRPSCCYRHELVPLLLLRRLGQHADRVAELFSRQTRFVIASGTGGTVWCSAASEARSLSDWISVFVVKPMEDYSNVTSIIDSRVKDNMVARSCPSDAAAIALTSLLDGAYGVSADRAATWQLLDARRFLRVLPRCGGLAVLGMVPGRASNPARLRMKARIKAINEAVQAEEYNKLLLSRTDLSSSAVPRRSTSSSHGRSSSSAAATAMISPGNHSVHLGGRLDQPAALQSARDGQPPETFGTFMKDVSIGLDMRLMSLAGGVVGYYLNYVRGASQSECIVAALIGVVSFMMLDALLLILRLRREDASSTTSQPRRGGLPPPGKSQHQR